MPSFLQLYHCFKQISFLLKVAEIQKRKEKNTWNSLAHTETDFSLCWGMKSLVIRTP